LYLAIILSLYSVTATGLAAQRLYDAQYPDFEPEGPDFEMTDESAISILPASNLFLNATVSETRKHWANHTPAMAVDGNKKDAVANHWAGLDLPNALVIDMGSVKPINTIALWTYWPGGRVYNYCIEGSRDNKSWDVLVDHREATPPSTSSGTLLFFERCNLRYVCVTMTANSAGNESGGHIVEIEGYNLDDSYILKFKKNWDTLPEGLQGSIGSVDHLYAKKSLPKLQSITNRWSGVAWRGERVYAQIVLYSKEDVRQLRFDTTPLMSDARVTLPNESLHPRFVRYVLAENKLCPDILDPIKSLDLPARSARPVWVTMNVPDDAEPGHYIGKISVLAASQKRLDFLFDLEVLPLALPAPGDWTFHLDLWQNPFAIARWHGVSLWSDEHFRLMEPYWRMLAEAGQKCLTVSLFHYPWGAQVYDGFEAMITCTRKTDGSWEYDFSLLDKYVAFAERTGLDDYINCYSMIPWNNRFRYIDGAIGDWKELEAKPGEPAYEAHWAPFLKAFQHHAKERGWDGRLTIAIDERPEKDVLIARKILRKYAPSIRLASATNHPPKRFELDDWSPYIANPVDPEVVHKRNKNPELATTFYVCCNPDRPNTFTFSPPAESVWMGLYAAAHNRTGFLRWAYNSWNENPFYDTKYWAKPWAAGDCFLIYPGPRSSIHFERLREGIVDYEKIRILRRMAKKQKNNPQLAKALRDLDSVLNEINFKNAQTVPVAEPVNATKASILDLSRALIR
jgi:hypothetical protein